MDRDLLVVLPALGTSVLSAIFGMAGGLILMGVYAACLPVTQAMVLHGWTQAVANGLRAALLRREIQGSVLGGYLIGAAMAWLLLRWLHWVPSPAAVFCGIGAMPFLGRWLSGRVRLPDIGRSLPAAVLAGLLVNTVQGMAGVAGPLLDLFFVETTLGRKAVVATKAATQVISHLLKLAWFLEVSPVRPEPWLLVATAAAAILGTVMGAQVLERLTDGRFRQLSRWLVLGIGGYYLLKGTRLWLS